jgi:hypothetical protein
VLERYWCAGEIGDNVSAITLRQPSPKWGGRVAAWSRDGRVDDRALLFLLCKRPNVEAEMRRGLAFLWTAKRSGDQTAWVMQSKRDYCGASERWPRGRGQVVVVVVVEGAEEEEQQQRQPKTTTTFIHACRPAVTETKAAKVAIRDSPSREREKEDADAMQSRRDGGQCSRFALVAG